MPAPLATAAEFMQYRLLCFGVDWHMHGPRTARRTLRPFVLALGALALALYVLAYLLGGSCDPVMSPYIPLVAGGLCVAVVVALGLLGGDHDGRRKQGALDWIGIIAFSLIAATGTVLDVGLVVIDRASGAWTDAAPSVG